MADPLFDKIDSITLDALRENVVFDSFFKDKSWEYRPGLKPKTRYLVVYERLMGMGIDSIRAHEVVGEMIAKGTITDPEEIVWVENKPDRFFGGIAMREPFTYAKLTAKEDTE